MAILGQIQTVIVCVPGSGDPGTCPVGSVPTVTQAYLVEPTSATSLDLMAAPFDAATAGQFFTFALVSTLFVYLFSFGVGQVIKMIRHS